jgi:hypothetical protein
VFFNGVANDEGSDHIFGFQGTLHRSNQFGIFQTYYGANFTLGSYQIKNYDHLSGNYGYGGPYDTAIRIKGSDNFFGSYGISGGINLVVTHQHIRYYRHSEWRILGIETSLQNEFGEYASRRDKMPDSLANIIYKRHFSAYLGLFTEWMWTNKHKTEFGFKLALGEDLNAGSNYTCYYAKSILPLYSFSLTYHVTKDRFAGFMQGNFGTYATNFQFGLCYRLGKK